MSLGRIATNIEAQKAYHSLNNVNNRMMSTQARMASGKKINTPEDDPAGYQLARTLEKRERGLAAALQNVTNAKSVLNIAEGAYQEIMDILQVVKEKATQAADTSLSQVQRDAVADQTTALLNEIDDIVYQTTFNGENLINGDYADKSFQVGEQADHKLDISLQNADSASVGVNSLSFATQDDANDAITTVSDAIDTLAALIQDVGEYAINPGPKKMIFESVDNVFSNLSKKRSKNLVVEIFVPKGEELAKKTLNARLGIKGGISILGTTGIVVPMSHDAYIATIKAGAKIAATGGAKTLVFTTGRRSERFAMKLLHEFIEECFIQTGDFFKASAYQSSLFL